MHFKICNWEEVTEHKVRNLSLVFLGPRRKHFTLALTRFFSWFPASLNLLFCPVSTSIKSPFASWDFFTTECLFNTIVSLSTLSSGLHSSLFYTRYAGKTSLATMIVLFFPMGMVTEETHQIPVQLRPFPVYPGWQVQTYNPLVFVQIAFTWQEWFPLHSSISEKPFVYLHFITLFILKWVSVV